VARSGPLVFAGATVIIAVVTVTLNLDTSVAFLTPVLVYTARSRAGDRADAAPALLYGCLLLSNAGSLLLPGSNLTNLIVLGHLRLTGGQFAACMWLPWLGALIVTAVVVGIGERRSLRGTAAGAGDGPAGAGGPWAEAEPAGRVGGLVGLFGVAVALGTLGRAWSGPAAALGHLDGWATAGVAAVAAVVLNNLPAASLLAARAVSHPFSLLVGLNLGPNLCVTGSLAWLLWLRAARGAGARPSLRRASILGLVAVPLSIAVALGALALTGTA
jgi:arsenical pump membrane protein